MQKREDEAHKSRECFVFPNTSGRDTGIKVDFRGFPPALLIKFTQIRLSICDEQGHFEQLHIDAFHQRYAFLKLI